MASTRVLRLSRPSGLGSSCFSNSLCSSMVSRSMAQMCLSKAGLNSKNVSTGGGGGDEKKTAVKAMGGCACVVISEPKTDKGVDLALLIANASDVILQWWIMITKQRPWKFNIQMFIEKAIVDCRFFTLFAIGGSLLGSVLCFVEGCFLILQSYLQYFRAISHTMQQGHVVQLLIEAIDVFLVGTAMLIFGMSLYVMFVGTNNLKGEGSQHLRPSLFGNFNVETIPSRVGIQSVMQAKSKIGHAVIMILLVEVLEKFKSIPVVTGWDLAFFAAAIFVSSASIFLLSRLAVAGTDTGK